MNSKDFQPIQIDTNSLYIALSGESIGVMIMKNPEN